MSGPLLGTFSIEGLRPLGSPAQRSFELVHSTLRAMLDDQHADLFAEPVAARHGNQTDWYANFAGTAQRASDLPESDRSALYAVLDTRLSAIRALAEGLARKKGSDEQRLAEVLQNACAFPDDASVFAVRGQDGALHPVITNWAWTRDQQPLVRGVLAGQALRPAAVLGGAAGTAGVTGAVDTGRIGGTAGADRSAIGGVDTDPTRRSGLSGFSQWLILAGWLLLALLIAAILWLMVAPCGLRPEALGNYCPPPASNAAAMSDQAQANLEADLAALERRFLLEQSQCTRDGEAQRIETYRAEKEAAEAGAKQLEAEQRAAQEALTIPDAPGNTAEAATEAEAQELEERVTENKAKQGELAFSLAWNSSDDIDLKVKCPSGKIVSYQTKTRLVCGGKLDIDANSYGKIVERPIENIFFDSPPPGRYDVIVRLHNGRSGQPQDFSLRVKPADGPARVVSGRVSRGQPDWSWSVVIGE